MSEPGLTSPAGGFPPPTQETGPPGRASAPPLAQRAIETVQTVLTALILAFVFRAFFVEAFIIPTGSMAETLLGKHATTVCPYCGWEYSYGPAAGASQPFRPPAQVQCPNCLRWSPVAPRQVAVKAGDRILVHKWPYLIGGPLRPKRWDVIVFRDPADPSQNYIKRLVGLPGETIEIIDGDLYVDGRIARKSPAAQSALWFIVFDQGYLPRPGQPGARWVAERSKPGPGWSGLDTRVIRYAAPDDAPRGIRFSPGGPAEYFQDVYGYNRGSAGNYVRDVRLRAEVTVREGSGWLACELTRGPYSFLARLRVDGRASLLLRRDGGGQLLIGARQVGALRPGQPRVLELAHVDRRCYLKVDGRQVLATSDAQYDGTAREQRRRRGLGPARLRVLAAAVRLELRGLRIERDVYYTYRPGQTLRAFAGHPFRLRQDEYFVLGDNSPHSADSREWYQHARHLSGGYRLGTVPADQIVGRAFFVYLPGLLPLGGQGWLRVPDVGRMRFIR